MPRNYYASKSFQGRRANSRGGGYQRLETRPAREREGVVNAIANALRPAIQYGDAQQGAELAIQDNTAGEGAAAPSFLAQASSGLASAVINAYVPDPTLNHLANTVAQTAITWIDNNVGGTWPFQDAQTGIEYDNDPDATPIIPDLQRDHWREAAERQTRRWDDTIEVLEGNVLIDEVETTSDETHQLRLGGRSGPFKRTFMATDEAYLPGKKTKQESVGDLQTEGTAHWKRPITKCITIIQ